MFTTNQSDILSIIQWLPPALPTMDGLMVYTTALIILSVRKPWITLMGTRWENIFQWILCGFRRQAEVVWILSFLPRCMIHSRVQVLGSLWKAKETLHFSVTQISWLSLIKEIIAVYSKSCTKSINAFCGQSTGLFNVKSCGAYSNYLPLKGQNLSAKFLILCIELRSH